MSEEPEEFVGILLSGMNEGGAMLPGGGGAFGGGGSDIIGGLDLSIKRVDDDNLERAPVLASSKTEDAADSIDCRRSCEFVEVLMIVANPVAVSLKTLVDGDGLGIEEPVKLDIEADVGAVTGGAGGRN